MKQFMQLYAVAASIFIVIDACWLTIVANRFYKDRLGSLLAETVQIIPAILFYGLFIVGLVVFVIAPGLQRNLLYVGANGALFGLVTYATYDLTNHATLKNWPLSVTIVDLLWGMCLSATVCVTTVLVYQKIIH